MIYRVELSRRHSTGVVVGIDSKSNDRSSLCRRGVLCIYLRTYNNIYICTRDTVCILYLALFIPRTTHRSTETYTRYCGAYPTINRAIMTTAVYHQVSDEVVQSNCRYPWYRWVSLWIQQSGRICSYFWIGFFTFPLHLSPLRTLHNVPSPAIFQRFRSPHIVIAATVSYPADSCVVWRNCTCYFNNILQYRRHRVQLVVSLGVSCFIRSKHPAVYASYIACGCRIWLMRVFSF